MSEKNTLTVHGKEIDFEINNKEHPCFRLELVADECAFYVNPGDDILVVDLNTKEFMGKDVGLKRYYETMDSIVNDGKPFEYGDAFVLLVGKHFIQSEKTITELDKKLQIADVVKRNTERQKAECGPDKTTQRETVKSENLGRE